MTGLGIQESTRDQLASKLGVLFPHLHERQRRPLMGIEARALGHGRIRAAEASDATVRKGMDGLDAGDEPPGGVCRPGGGRKAEGLGSWPRPALLAWWRRTCAGIRCHRRVGQRIRPET